ncbi:hypothetical protein DPMN_024364 [Dreissena polymorpha]|uniref:Tyrosine-protein kinase ephrin type A/B receptor-like domain-containing protein n=1 Tax=Dreissena polymorpha TaxID=45954 RepID=A0A9D4CQQ6_DREPO|nr:hypothetical protein DPMN_054513 [Dreissena polymorpha]KAH3861435.1 hypothetical protein DPMN_024364 [Dreissena polymorpha]
MECPVNTYNDQFNQLTCKPCPIGTTTRASGSDELTDCRPGGLEIVIPELTLFISTDY